MTNRRTLERRLAQGWRWLKWKLDLEQADRRKGERRNVGTKASSI